MAETCAVAFGRYIRTLRERRGLSLIDVQSLSRTFSDSIHKSYLSRCENGRQKLAFSKMIALSRIYEVPSEVLLERMELDLELDRVGGPDTAGLVFEELQDRGKESSNRGALWDSYAYFRDAVPVAADSPLMRGLEDPEDQLFCARLNYSTAAGSLGRSRLALHELEYLLGSGGLDRKFGALLYERLANQFCAMGELEKATAQADRAIATFEDLGLDRYLGYAYATRAQIASAQGDHAIAIELFKKSFGAYRSAGRRDCCARNLLNLAGAYFEAGHTKASRRAVASCEKLSAALGLKRTQALARILRGLILERDGHERRAAAEWLAALDDAKRLGDRALRFKAEFYLFRHARRGGDAGTAAALERRLRKLTPWIPADVEELTEFKRLSG